jgi:hypothetical protein
MGEAASFADGLVRETPPTLLGLCHLPKEFGSGCVLGQSVDVAKVHLSVCIVRGRV